MKSTHSLRVLLSAPALLFSLILFVGCRNRKEFALPESPMVGTPALHFVFHNVHGRGFATESFQGRNVVLLFIRPGQPAIQDLLREVEKMQEDPALTEVEFVALLPEEDPLTRPFWIGLRNDVKFGLDFTGASERYGAGDLPLMVIWDYQMIIRFHSSDIVGKSFYPRLRAIRNLVLELERDRTRPSS